MALTCASSSVPLTLAVVRARYVPVRIANCASEAVLESVCGVAIGTVRDVRLQLKGQLPARVPGRVSA